MALPPGFELEQKRPTSLPPGFELEGENAPAATSEYSPEALKMIEDIKTRGWGTGLPKATYEAGGKVTDLLSKIPALRGEPAAAAGGATNFLLNAIPAFLSGGRVEGAQTTAASWPARKLMQSALKPSPVADKAKVAGAVKTMLEEGYSPTNAGVSAMSDKARALKAQVDALLAPSKKLIDVAPVAQGIEASAGPASAGTLGANSVRTAKDVAKQLYKHPSVDRLGTMTVQDAQAMKQANYKELGDAAYGLGLKPAAERDALKAAARVLKESIEKAEPGVAAPNAKIQELINALKFASRRATTEANKDIVPLGASVATAVSNPVAALGLYANSSAAIKAALGRMLYSGGTHAGPGLRAMSTYANAQDENAPDVIPLLAQQIRKKLGEQ